MADKEPQTAPIVLVRMRTVLLLLIAVAAWQSNPELTGFRHWLKRELLQQLEEDHSAERKLLVALIDSAEVERVDLGFGSIVTVHDIPVTTSPVEPGVERSSTVDDSTETDLATVRFAGVFGNWFPLRW
ncbi:MAG: hypothetical protein R3C18_04620 [Planctomycetaceae bacterium]